jgi:sec-independent protein translocase protein TatA
MFTLAFFGNLGPMEMLVLLVLGLLIFGKRLPEMGRNVGKSIVEFKKGLSGADEDVNAAANASRAGNMAPPPQQYQQAPTSQQYNQAPAAPQVQQYQQPPQQLPPQQPQHQAEARPAQQPDQTNRQA